MKSEFSEALHLRIETLAVSPGLQRFIFAQHLFVRAVANTHPNQYNGSVATSPRVRHHLEAGGGIKRLSGSGGNKSEGVVEVKTCSNSVGCGGRANDDCVADGTDHNVGGANYDVEGHGNSEVTMPAHTKNTR